MYGLTILRDVRGASLAEVSYHCVCIDAFHKDINASSSMMDWRQMKGLRTGSDDSERQDLHH